MNISKTHTNEYSEDQAKRSLSWLAWYMTRNYADVIRIRDLRPTVVLRRMIDLRQRVGFKRPGDDTRLSKFTYALVLELLRILIFGLILGLGFVLNFGWKFGLILGLVIGPIFYIFDGFATLIIYGLENIWFKKWRWVIWTREWNGWSLVADNSSEDTPNRKAEILNYVGGLILMLINIGSAIIFVVSLIYWDFRSYGLSALLMGTLITWGMVLFLLNLKLDKIKMDMYTDYELRPMQWPPGYDDDSSEDHRYAPEDWVLRWNWRSAKRGGVMLSCAFGLIFAPCFWLIFWLSGRLIAPPESTLLSFGLILVPIGGLMGAIFSGLTFEYTDGDRRRRHPHRLFVRNAAYGGFVFLLSFGSIFIMTLGLKDGLISGLFAGLAGLLRFGGFIVIRIFLKELLGNLEYVLGLVKFLALSIRGYIPFNYTRFLNYAVDRLILQKVGDDGYRFIHRMLREHFAEMYEWEKTS